MQSSLSRFVSGQAQQIFFFGFTSVAGEDAVVVAFQFPFSASCEFKTKLS
jgi:hypothetical protein